MEENETLTKTAEELLTDYSSKIKKKFDEWKSEFQKEINEDMKTAPQAFTEMHFCGKNRFKNIDDYFDVLEKNFIESELEREGKKEGYWKFYSEDGLWLESEGNYKKDKQEGLWKIYFKNGNIKSIRNIQINENDRIVESRDVDWFPIFLRGIPGNWEFGSW